MGLTEQLDVPAAVPLGKVIPGTRWMRGWMGPKEGMELTDKRKKSWPFWESNPGLSYHSPYLYRLNYPGSIMILMI
jgi:hypothetical protein